jgi:carbamate kinase
MLLVFVVEEPMTSDSKESPIAIVAMGGHAFMKPGEKGTIEEHERNAASIAGHLMTLVERNYNLVITHGNGPQVGNSLLRNEMARNDVPAMPLDVLVADTAGSLGYIMQQAMLNQLRRRHIERWVVTVVSQVLVNGDDAAFDKPTKPIGPFLDQAEAERRRDTLGWNIVEDSGRGWRRVVPSPKPHKIFQGPMIRDSVIHGHIVISCGGGGVPVRYNENNDIVGVEAVIDKDLTSSLLGVEVGAELMIILTEVDQVYLNFKTPDQRPLHAVTLAETEEFIKQGHFAPGSMGPKVEAVASFLRGGGKRGLITSAARLRDALDGRAGTHFIGRV